ncbi:MAG: hypothetical protein LBJ31_03495 [Treponema sp.]|jgi:copper homeostasis protein|nr:hypothetical protein [Treponema sp.]
MINGITIEVCIENGTRIDELAAHGPGLPPVCDRVELNDNLAAGGITAQYDTSKDVIDRCHRAGIKVMSMIRPRGGNFIYSDDEFSVMLRDVEKFGGAESDGVVFGCLDAEGAVDGKKVAALVKAARNMTTVFHMAFDCIGAKTETPADEARLLEARLAAIERLAEAGVTRILTGGALYYRAAPDAFANRERIRTYAKAASGRIGILPGGGITKENYARLCAYTGLSEVHGSRLP